MAQAAGFRHNRVHIFNRTADQNGEYGRNSGGRQYQYVMTISASFRFNKGSKSMREGAVDAYDVVMFGMLYRKEINRESMLVYDGRTWKIQSFNRDFMANEIQITAIEAPGIDLTGLVPYSPSSSTISGGSSQQHEIGNI